MRDGYSTRARANVPTPLGGLVIECSDGAIARCRFEDEKDAAGARPQPAKQVVVAPRVVAALRAYFAGRVGAIDGLDVRLDGTPFQVRVWRALRRIPAGQTRTYGEIARAVGKPGAARAVGTACHRNRVGIVVPCHRVVGAGGALTGYGAGIDRKAWLIDHERKATAGRAAKRR